MKEYTIRKFDYPRGERLVCKEECSCEECAERIEVLSHCTSPLLKRLLAFGKAWEYCALMESCNLKTDYMLHPKLTHQEFMVAAHNVAILHLLRNYDK